MKTRVLTIEVTAETHDWLEAAGCSWGALLGTVSPFCEGKPISPGAVAAECVERTREHMKRTGSLQKSLRNGH